jgi:AraC family transcriptional regulator, ethanolamine operon transcriptional activator
LSRKTVVERVEAYAREHADDLVTVSTLCRLVGLSERGLRNAFYSVRGMSPKRCLLAERLRNVRRALSEEPKPITVTTIATRYGFYELGRFAKTYKQAFGEFPSQTLYGMDRESVIDSRGHSHAGTI